MRITVTVESPRGSTDVLVDCDDARAGEQLVEQRPGLAAVVGPGGLDQRDRLGEGPAVAGRHPIGQRRRQEAGSFSRTSSITREAASGMLVPGPNTATTPASKRKS